MAPPRTHHCQFRAYHRALMVRRGYKRAIVATAHKLARCVFAVPARPRPLPRPGHPTTRPCSSSVNAPRWLRKLYEF